MCSFAELFHHGVKCRTFWKLCSLTLLLWSANSIPKREIVGNNCLFTPFLTSGQLTLLSFYFSLEIMFSVLLYLGCVILPWIVSVFVYCKQRFLAMCRQFYGFVLYGCASIIQSNLIPRCFTYWDNFPIAFGRCFISAGIFL